MQYLTLLLLSPFLLQAAFATPVDPPPVGSKENPAKIKYQPSQPYQNEIINSNPNLKEPMQKTTSQSPAQNRKDTYAAYGDAPPGFTKEDQPPASVEHHGKPGSLNPVPKSEQGKQAGEISAASKEAGEVHGEKSGWVIQETPEMRGEKSDPKEHGFPPPIPKKKHSGKRHLVAREALAEAMAEAYAHAYAHAYHDATTHLGSLLRREAGPFPDARPDPYAFANPSAEPEPERLYAREAMPSYLY